MTTVCKLVLELMWHCVTLPFLNSVVFVFENLIRWSREKEAAKSIVPDFAGIPVDQIR